MNQFIGKTTYVAQILDVAQILKRISKDVARSWIRYNLVHNAREVGTLPLLALALCLIFESRVAGAVETPRRLIRRDSEKAAEKQDLLLIAGLQTVLDVSFAPCEPVGECIKIINPQVVTVQYAKEKRQLVFTPIKNGETTISVRDENGDLKLIFKAIVSNNNLARAAREIKDLLRDIEGLDMKILGNKIVVDGEIIVPNDLNRVFAVLSDAAYKDMVLNLVSVSPIGQKILARRMQDEINNPKITVRIMNGTFILEGNVDSPLDSDRAMQIVLNLMPEKIEFKGGGDNIEFKHPKKSPVINLIRVAARKEPGAPKLIRMTINFVELAKNYDRVFGFAWAPGMDTGGSIGFGQSTTGGLTSTSNGALSGTISNLFPKLKAAQQAGYARFLQEMVLLTQSGSQGQVRRKQNIPVPVVDTKTGIQTYNAVPVGLGLSVTPTVSGQSDTVGLNIDFTFSSIVGRTVTAPTTAESTYKGKVSVKSGESAAIANLVTNDILTNYNKDAPNAASASANPLFSLLRSKAFQKDKSQFVIFVTPQIMESAGTGTEDIKRKYGFKRR